VRLASSCPKPDDLERFLLADLPEDDADRLLAHVSHCSSCSQTAGSLKAEDKLTEAMHWVRATSDNVPVSALVETLMARLSGLASVTGESATVPFESTGAQVATRAADSTEEIYDFLAPAQLPDELGRLGPYRVLKVLGFGGMGVVFLAEDPHLQRRVALKTMKSALARNPRACDRFLREARAAAGVKHDHIVTIYQVGEDRGVPFLAMELLAGESLEDRLRHDGKLPAADVARIGQEIAQGLAAAHAHGLVHRDIKPGNIWLEARNKRQEARCEADSPLATHHSPVITAHHSPE
jgi:hypothetical protein